MGLFRKRDAPDLDVKDLGDGTIEVTAWKLNGGGMVEVVGESYYFDSLAAIVGGGRAMNLPVTAALLPEPDNVNDPNAISVHVDGYKVGHLSRHAAKLYQPVVSELAKRGMVGACDARISGSGEAYGVFLDLADPEHCLSED